MTTEVPQGVPPGVPPLVLLVEDEPQMRRFLRRTLESHGYRLVEADTARQGLAHATAHNPDVVLLDLGLPDLDGLELTRQLREWSQTPIVVISARGEEASKIAALDAGADDYLTKPFAAGELLARIRVALRHAARSASGREEPVVTFGAVRVDLARRLVFRSDVEVHLTPNEYKLLAAFARNPGRVLTHPQLLREVWGKSAAAEPHVLRVYVNQLRQKLEDEPARPRFLRTEPGVGYRLRTEG